METTVQQVNETELRNAGWYLEDYHLIWLNDGLVDLVYVPVEMTISLEYDKFGGLSSEDEKVQNMRHDWASGYRFPVIEGYRQDDSYVVNDGQHRRMAWMQDHTEIPMLVTRNK